MLGRGVGLPFGEKKTARLWERTDTREGKGRRGELDGDEGWAFLLIGLSGEGEGSDQGCEWITKKGQRVWLAI